MKTTERMPTSKPLKRVLSTKYIASLHPELTQGEVFSYQQYNAIETHYCDTSYVKKHIEKHTKYAQITGDNTTLYAIITSKKAIHALQEIDKTILKKFSGVFCVGKRTATLLEKQGYNVMQCFQYAHQLVEYLETHHKKNRKNTKNTHFIFFCGDLRLATIPSFFEENTSLNYREITVYKTTLHPQKFHQSYWGVLVFSPSAVKALLTNNTHIDWQETHFFCIGKTTAKAIYRHIKNPKIYYPEVPSVANTVSLVLENANTI